MTDHDRTWLIIRGIARDPDRTSEGVSLFSGVLLMKSRLSTLWTACDRELQALRYLDQLRECRWLEAGSSDQSTIDRREACDGCEVGRLDAAAVQNRDGTTNCRSEKLLEVLADEAMCLLYLLICGIHPRSNSPYRFIRDNELSAIGEPDVAERGIQLPKHDLFDLAGIALFECLSNAQYRNQGCLKGVDQLAMKQVGRLTNDVPSFRMPYEHVGRPCRTDHGRRYFSRECAFDLGRDILSAEQHPSWDRAGFCQGSQCDVVGKDDDPHLVPLWGCNGGQFGEERLGLLDGLKHVPVSCDDFHVVLLSTRYPRRTSTITLHPPRGVEQPWAIALHALWRFSSRPVSYTHLTLPTIYSV